MTITNRCAIVSVVVMLAIPAAAQSSRPMGSAPGGPARPAVKFETPPALEHAKSPIDSRHFPEAVEECSRLIDSAAGSIYDRHAALFCRALALHGMANRADALRDLQAILDSKKCTLELRKGAVAEQITLHRELKDWQAVLDDAAAQRPLVDDETRVWLLLAIMDAHTRQDENEKVIKDSMEGLALPNLPTQSRLLFLLGRGFANERLKRLAAAREDYTAVMRDPDSPADYKEAAKAHLEGLQLSAATQPTTKKS